MGIHPYQLMNSPPFCWGILPDYSRFYDREGIR